MTMKDREELHGPREGMLQEAKQEGKKNERGEMRNHADAVRPWQSLTTTKRPNITTRNTNTTKNNTTTTTRTTSRKGIATSASDYTRGANQPGHQGTADGRRKCSYEGSNEQREEQETEIPPQDKGSAYDPDESKEAEKPAGNRGLPASQEKHLAPQWRV
jgi:hypothetical protein